MHGKMDVRWFFWKFIDWKWLIEKWFMIMQMMDWCSSRFRNACWCNMNQIILNKYTNQPRISRERIFHHGLYAILSEDDDSENVSDRIADGVNDILSGINKINVNQATTSTSIGAEPAKLKSYSTLLFISAALFNIYVKYVSTDWRFCKWSSLHWFYYYDIHDGEQMREITWNTVINANLVELIYEQRKRAGIGRKKKIEL